MPNQSSSPSSALRKRVLITGAAKRLGRAIAEAAAARGWDLVLHYRASETAAVALQKTLEAQGRRVTLVQGDLTETADLDRIAAALFADGDGVGRFGLVNSASIFHWDNLWELDEALMFDHYRVNTFAPAWLSKRLAQDLPDGADGAIVNILDQKLKSMNGDHLSYTLAKYALKGLTEVLALDLAPRIRVNGVSPGYVLPAPDQTAEDYERRKAITLLERATDVAEVAEVAALLLDNGAVTGEIITVDSGLSLMHHRRDISYL